MNLNFVDILIVGIPETILSILCAVALFGKKESWMRLFIRALAGTALILIANNLIRLSTQNVIVIAMSSVALLTIILRILIGYTWRQSILGASLSMYVIMGAEIFGLDLSLRILNNISAEKLLTSSRFMVSVPTRIAQIGILIFLVYKNFNLSKVHIFSSALKDMEPQEKSTALTILTSSVLSIVMISTYVDLIVNINNLGIERDTFSTSLTILMITTVFFFAATGIMITKAINHTHMVSANKVLIELLERRRKNVD